MALVFQNKNKQSFLIMKIYLATWLLEESQGIVMTNKGKKERLLSYFHILPKKKYFKRYIKTGR